MKHILNISALFLLFSCGNTEEKVVETENSVIETCTLEYNNETLVNWTAFKLTEKVGVNGTFDSVVVSNTNVSDNVEEMLKGAEFSIYTNTVNSKDSLRDWKLANKFFNVMSQPEVISGSILSLENGAGKVSLTMNGITKNTPISYRLKDDSEVVLETTINIPDWEAQPALDSIGVVCEAKHTGPDGINKLWPDVEVKVFIGVNKECK